MSGQFATWLNLRILRIRGFVDSWIRGFEQTVGSAVSLCVGPFGLFSCWLSGLLLLSVVMLLSK